MSEFAGHLALRAERRADDRTIIAAQAFQAPFHLSKPYWDGATLIVQVVNPTAGILAGDTLKSEIAVASGAALLVTTPSASRVFHMKSGSANSRQHFTIASESWLEVWPEPLVPHLNSDFHQVTEIDAAAGAEFFFADYLLPGRIARGEIFSWRRLCLELRVRVGGELVLQERFDQTGAELARLASLAGRGEGAAFGNIVFTSEKLLADESWQTALRDLQSSEAQVGVSRLRGSSPTFSLKIVAADGDALRRTLRGVRNVLRTSMPHLSADPRKL
ncbi:MAG TPA: urease accessory protein UreD [Opitutaceae bacterium]|nr:urease accessory protein UreD [Opitutaceae bacterium]